MMDLALRANVRRKLIATIGDQKVLWKTADLSPYTRDAHKIRAETFNTADDFSRSRLPQNAEMRV